MKSYICADYVYQGDEPQIFYRRYLGMFEEEKLGLNSIWQIEHITDEHFGDQFNSYQNNEAMVVPKMTTKPVKLRHLLTGRLITLRKSAGSGDQYEATLGKEKLAVSAGHTTYFTRTTHKINHSNSNNPRTMEQGNEYFFDDEVPDQENEIHRVSKVFNLYFELVIVEERQLRNKSLVLLKTNNSYLSSSKLPKLERKFIRGAWEE